MFGIGMTEIILILALALIIIGPDKLPEIARTLGKGFADFKRQTDDMKDAFRTGIVDAQREEEKKNPHEEAVTAQGKAEKALPDALREAEGLDPIPAVDPEDTTATAEADDRPWVKVEESDDEPTETAAVEEDEEYEEDDEYDEEEVKEIAEDSATQEPSQVASADEDDDEKNSDKA